jgi:hypothetical protein
MDRIKYFQNKLQACTGFTRITQINHELKCWVGLHELYLPMVDKEY